MRIVRREQRVLLVVLAVLVLGTAWSSFGHPAGVSHANREQAGHVARGDGGIVAPADVSDSITVPILGALRTVEPRLASLWALPGLAAALVALCVLRRLRRTPALPARRALLRGSLAEPRATTRIIRVIDAAHAANRLRERRAHHRDLIRAAADQPLRVEPSAWKGIS